MPRGIRAGLPAELEILANRLEAHRKNRSAQTRCRLPESLWAQAARLGQQYGVCRVRRALRLNYYDLKQRVDSLPKASQQALVSATKPLRPAFVELGVSPSLAGSTTTLELEDGQGRKLTVRLAREDSRELVALVHAVWGGAP